VHQGRTYIDVVIDGEDRTFDLTELSSVSIGRHPQCTVVIGDDPNVSRKHALIHREASGEYYLSDLGSRNGTTRNGLPVTSPVPLRDGDSFMIGSHRFVFHQTAPRAEEEQAYQDPTDVLVVERMLTVLVLDIRNYTGLARELGESRITEVMNRLFHESGRLLKRHGSWAQKYIGDAVMSIWVVSAGNNQSATVNTAVATPPRVLVRDAFNNPVPAHQVTFAVTAGGGTVVPTTPVLTAADGTATATSWTLGTAAGTNNNTLQATAAGTGIAGNPVTFTASATAGAPASIAVSAGNNQTAVTGTNVATPPTVVVRDAFANPVPNIRVNFTTTGGSVGAAADTTGATGVASVTWAPNVSGGTMQSNGAFPDTLTATVHGTAIFTRVFASAIYSYATHVNPIWTGNVPACTGCHTGAGTSGLTLAGTSAQNYAALVNVNPVCDASLAASGYRRVSAAGGVNAADVYSILMRLVDPALTPVGTCGDGTGHTTKASSGNLTILRAWIRNGAPNN
jgi:pSer/pThr/pTyr-binding forkhead associated (FHA) protein